MKEKMNKIKMNQNGISKSFDDVISVVTSMVGKQIKIKLNKQLEHFIKKEVKKQEVEAIYSKLQNKLFTVNLIVHHFIMKVGYYFKLTLNFN